MRAEARVRITNPSGLHARPVVKRAQLAGQFSADIRLEVDDGGWIMARSVAKVMKLRAGADAELRFQADGEQADLALQALVDLVRRNFGEPAASAEASVASASAPSDSGAALNHNRRLEHDIFCLGVISS